ncbi:competence protein ComEC [Microbacterium sp. W4I4]|uniref:ComEC/Rec2 family competence protein n=1 Tax=Microbacterium sp. W4I4 TaxID=3042295 RepID=UPI002782C496|nr:ComEC/Rec2 family competence protein [Microbacterium sp. W4I4]MDQ0612597.1 competence protein ComEC [Microbacterium sp. W4I4]
MKDLRTSLLAVILWASALLCIQLPMIALPMAGACGTGAVLALVACRVTRASGLRMNGLVVLTLLCCCAVGLSVAAAQPQRAVLGESDGRAVAAIVTVSSSTSVGSDGRLWFDAQTIRFGAPGDMDPISASVRIGVDPVDGVDLGAVVEVSGQAKGTEPSEQAGLVIFATDAEVVSPASGIFAIAASTRAEFVARATRLPEPGAGLLPGLAVGDTRAVSEQLNAAMLASGLSHLTAVSGANCMIVVAAVFWLVSLAGGSRLLRVALSLLALGAFVVLVTPEASVVRAAVMAALAMLSVLLGRPSAGLAMLSLAVCGLLIADPWFAASPGFALSAAATAALLVLSRPLLRGLGRWMPVPLALALSVPLAAQVVCGPIIALFSEQQSLVGVAANLIAAPAAPIATVIGLLACLTSAVPAVADLLAAAAWLPAAWIDMTATVSAGLPGATIAVVAGPVAAMLVGVISTAATVVLVWPRSRRLRTASVVVLVVALGLGGSRMLLDGPLARLTSPGEWTIAMCDIGQGDAVLIRSADRIALIDTGPDPDALRSCLAQTGVSRIDLLVLTHFDLDHVGGTSAVVGRVGTVLHGPVAEDDEHRMLADLAGAGATVRDASIGMSGSLGEARWKVLWPEADPVVFPSGNDASVVLEIAGGGIPRALLLGDLGAVSQRMLLASGRVRGTYAVVKVAHHGSGDQEPELYAEVRAPVALIGVGADNDYGHPRAETLAFLDAVGSRALRTDLRGLILVGARKDELLVWSAKSPPDGG